MTAVAAWGAGARLAIAAAAMLAFAQSSAAPPPKVHTVVIAKMRFGPVPKEVRTGDVILWVNKDVVKHTATARDRSFDLDLAAGASGKTMIRNAGSIAFYCIYHPGMKGVLVVK